MKGLFLERTNDRKLPDDYQGDVLVWDIDKTYLDTRFSSWRGLLSIPLEFAIDKRAIPGAVPLIRALRRGAQVENALVPLYFVSGSPRELRPVIERKMTLDGVEFDGITFKDQLGLALSGKPGLIKAQVGYKLTALLLYLRETPRSARWLLFGDDVEQDAAAFLLFGEVAAGLRGSALEERLRESRVSAREVETIVDLAATIPASVDPVERIFIHVVSGRAGPAGPRITSSRSFLTLAMVAAAMNRIRPEDVAAVAADLRQRSVPEAEIAAAAAEARSEHGVPEDLVRYTAR